jgi:acyl-CoA thioesterase
VPSHPYDPFADGLMGIVEGPTADGVNRSHLDVRPAVLNAQGATHGGATFSLIDHSLGAAVDSVLGDGESNVTIELKVNYLAPVRAGRIDCESRVLRRGRRLVIAEADVHNDGRLVAKGLGTFAVVPRS